MQRLTIDPSNKKAPTRDHQQDTHPTSLPAAKTTQLHPTKPGTENASLYFVGTATTILEWEGIRIMTDPNFLHAGDHVHLGPGVTATRVTDPSVDLHELPRIDVILLSHYHADHFDQKVEASLRRSLPIITTPHAKEHLTSKGKNESFTSVVALDTFQSILMDVKNNASQAAIRVTAMPGKHVPPGVLGTLNDLVSAVPPTNGWMLELGIITDAMPPEEKEESFHCIYRIYISGDTLMVDELKSIPERYKDQNIDLMLVHLGGTTIPSPKLPLLMVTMDAVQGIQLMRLIDPDITIPVHYDDYDVFLSPLEDFRKEVEKEGLMEKVVFLGRGDKFDFKV
ncbi:hypothetical protein PVAG01_09692 [Phlyctema vagabunda]|uniref:Metallo-beta-lactamase domain-containing protein n=1 Tax=Phlyctema vagabunda TaxID=108571 RepID=A0ABR4P822_9HELO